MVMEEMGEASSQAEWKGDICGSNLVATVFYVTSTLLEYVQ